MKQKNMSWNLLFSLVLMTTSLYAFDYEDYLNDAERIDVFQTDKGVAYSLWTTLSLLGAPEGAKFNTSRTTGSPSPMEFAFGTRAEGKVIIPQESLPSKEFTISMNGYLEMPSGENGNELTWGTKGVAPAPLRIAPIEGAGVFQEYTTFRDMEKVSSKWTVESGASLHPENGESTLITSPVPGEYKITATNNRETASATFTYLEMKFKDKNGVEISSLKIASEGSEQVLAELLPVAKSGKFAADVHVGSSGHVSLSGGGISSPREILTVTGNRGVATGSGKLVAKYKNKDVLGELDVEVVNVGVRLAIKP